MAAHRTSITLDSALYAAAQKRMEQTFTSNFSDYVAWLIRQDVLEKERLRSEAAMISSVINDESVEYSTKKKTA